MKFLADMDISPSSAVFLRTLDMTRFICTMKASTVYRTRAFWPKR